MSLPSTARKAGALMLSGAAIGGALGYAVSASGAPTTHAGTAGRAAHAKAGRSRLKRAVSITAVVPLGDGRFATVSIARGVLVSTSGDSLTLREGTRKATYKTVTLPLGANARIRLSKQPSSLQALSAGDRVAVVTGPHRTAVVARPPKAKHTTEPSHSKQTTEATGASS